MMEKKDYKDLTTKKMNRTKVETVERAVSSVSGVPIFDMMSKKRTPECSRARMVVWYIVNQMLCYPSTYLARRYDKDHTTILHGIKVIKRNKEVVEIAKKIVENKCPEILQTKIKGDKNMKIIGDWAV